MQLHLGYADSGGHSNCDGRWSVEVFMKDPSMKLTSVHSQGQRVFVFPTTEMKEELARSWRRKFIRSGKLLLLNQLVLEQVKDRKDFVKKRGKLIRRALRATMDVQARLLAHCFASHCSDKRIVVHLNGLDRFDSLYRKKQLETEKVKKSLFAGNDMSLESFKLEEKDLFRLRADTATQAWEQALAEFRKAERKWGWLSWLEIAEKGSKIFEPPARYIDPNGQNNLLEDVPEESEVTSDGEGASESETAPGAEKPTESGTLAETGTLPGEGTLSENEGPSGGEKPRESEALPGSETLPEIQTLSESKVATESEAPPENATPASEKQTESTPPVRCPICWIDILPNDVKHHGQTFCCKRLYHFDCIKRLCINYQTQSCPNCRRDWGEVRHLKNFDDMNMSSLPTAYQPGRRFELPVRSWGPGRPKWKLLTPDHLDETASLVGAGGDYESEGEVSEDEEGLEEKEVKKIKEGGCPTQQEDVKREASKEVQDETSSSRKGVRWLTIAIVFFFGVVSVLTLMSVVGIQQDVVALHNLMYLILINVKKGEKGGDREVASWYVVG